MQIKKNQIRKWVEKLRTPIFENVLIFLSTKNQTRSKTFTGWATLGLRTPILCKNLTKEIQVAFCDC